MGAKKSILAILALKLLVLAKELCPYELIFHAYKEENCIETLSVIEKSFNLGKIGKY